MKCRLIFAIIIIVVIASAESLFSIKLNSILYQFYIILILYDENFLGHQIKRNFMHQFNIIFIHQMNEKERET